MGQLFPTYQNFLPIKDMDKGLTKYFNFSWTPLNLFPQFSTCTPNYFLLKNLKKKKI